MQSLWREILSFFIQQWGWFEISLVAIFITVGAVFAFSAIPHAIEDSKLNLEQKELIPDLDCRELGELILSKDLRRFNEAFAERHWHIRCE